jgi:hypothetical protein
VELPLVRGGPLAMANRTRNFTIESLEDRTVPAQASLDPGVTFPDTTQQPAATGHVHHTSVTPPPAGPSTSGVVGSSGDPEVRFVQKLYFDLLGRGIDSGAQGYIDGLNNAGLSRHDVAEAILDSEEYTARRINLLYESFFHRRGDEASVSAYVKSVVDGDKSLEEISIELLESDEYRTLHPNASQLVNALFEDVFGRRPDPTSASTYTSRVEVSAEGIAEEIVTSQESRKLAGEAAFELMLNQEPTGNLGMKAVADAQDGDSIESILANLAASDEYFNLTEVR